MTSDELLPFLSTVSTPTRPLTAALRSMPAVESPSPWSPKVQAEAAMPAIDVDAVRTEAMAAGRAEGLRETAALRAQLATMIGELQAARDGLAKPVVELIADAAVAVIEGWTGNADRRELFAPIVRAWTTSGDAPARARCHPGEVEALRAEIGEAAIVVEPDPTKQPGEITITDPVRELAHSWDARLRELREAIAAALVEP